MSTRKALLIVLTEKYASIAIQLIGSVVVARLLTPEEFGIFSLAMAISILAQVFRDLGIGQYLIQEKELTLDKIKSAQFLITVSSFLIGTLIILASEQIANYYQQSDITNLLYLMGINFFFLPIGAMTFAIWKRELKFLIVSLTGTASTLSNTITTIYLASNGYSYMSLGWGVIAGSCVTAIICILFSPQAIPLFPGIKKIGHVVKYSSLATFNSLLDTVTDRSPTLFLGKTSTIEDVGLYERAAGVGELFNRLVMQAIWSIALPAFSDLSRKKLEICKPYLHATSIIFTFGSYFYIFLAFNSEIIITLLFGEQWKESSLLLVLICIRQIVGLPNSLASGMILAHGKIGEQTKMSAILHGSLFIAIAISSVNGTKNLLECMIIASVIAHCSALWIINKFVPAKNIIITLIKPAASCLILIFTLLLLKQLSLSQTKFLISSALISAILIIACSAVLELPIYKEFSNTIKSTKQKNKALIKLKNFIMKCMNKN